MSGWRDEPDGDGIWNMQRVSDGANFVSFVQGSHVAHLLLPSGNATSIVWLSLDQGLIKGAWKFCRCEIVSPEPYVAPKPPHVQQYTAQCKKNGEFRFLTRLGSRFVSTDEDGDDRGGFWLRWDDRESLYADIQEIKS